MKIYCPECGAEMKMCKKSYRGLQTNGGMVDREEIKNMASFVAKTYKKYTHIDKIIDVVKLKYPGISTDMVCSMVFAIDAYVGITDIFMEEQ